MLISSLRQDLCLDYANTRFWRGREAPTETLHSLADLLGWLEASGGMDAKALRGIAAWSRSEPAAAQRLFADAMVLREALQRIFSALAAGKRLPRRDFTSLQQALAAAPPRSRLGGSASACGWEIEPPPPLAAHLLTQVLWSAGDLVAGGNKHQLRQCANSQCLWLFLDNSKNASRRWCAMASCGNRAKAQRHYLKMTRGEA